MRYSVEVHNAGGYVPSGEREVPVQVPNPVWQPAVPESRQFQCPNVYSEPKYTYSEWSKNRNIQRNCSSRQRPILYTCICWYHHLGWKVKHVLAQTSHSNCFEDLQVPSDEMSVLVQFPKDACQPAVPSCKIDRLVKANALLDWKIHTMSSSRSTEARGATAISEPGALAYEFVGPAISVSICVDVFHNGLYEPAATVRADGPSCRRGNSNRH
jgi:hypothetical protein